MTIDAANPHFGSDNYAGVCPEVLDAFREHGGGHCAAYGDDPLTKRACDAIRAWFDRDCEVFFVFSGTAANSLALASICQSYHAIICSPKAHLEEDECNAPAFFSNGARLLPTNDTEGKVTPAELTRLLRAREGDIHFSKSRVLSITQATELGSVYSRDELRTLCDLAHDADLMVHMDGARFVNAVVSLDVHPKEVVEGIDVLSFGGTKMGMPLSEAVVFFNRKLAEDFEYRRKQAGQLASKMRFLAIPWIAMLEDDTWRRYARNANARAQQLAARVRAIPGINIRPVEANGVFLTMPPAMVEPLRRLWKFYPSEHVRFMCAWDTTSEDVEALAADIERLANG